MIKIVLVAGHLTEKLSGLLDRREYDVVRQFSDVSELWDDIFQRGNSSYLDVDKIVVMSTGLLNENVMKLEEQVLNIQSAMSINGLRSNLYMLIKDADLYKKISEDMDEYISYKYFVLLLFNEINTRNFESVLKGHYDGKGLFHPDFLKKNELDAKLNIDDDDEEEEVEPEPEEPKIDANEYADNKDSKKEIAKKEREERRNSRRSEKNTDKPSKGLIGNILKGSDKNKNSTRDSNKNRSKALNDLYRGVIAVTGDRQTGVSTTVANMAEIYAKNGLSVLIVDLDIKRRMQTKIFPNFMDAIKLESRVSHGLLVSLVNPKNLDSVYSVVSDNIAVLSISDEVERDIKKFANRNFEQIFNDANIVNLFNYAKSHFDVVLVDLPLEYVKSVGKSLSYVDKVIMCVPNTEYHLDSLLEVEIDELVSQDDLIANILLAKGKILLTKYNTKSKIDGTEMTPSVVMDMLSSLDESIFHLEVIGKVKYSENYEAQFERGHKIVSYDNNFKKDFEDFMTNIH